jgi:hypothetical protein
VGTAAVLLLPGVLVARLLRMRLAVLATWAAVPMFSLAIVFLLGEVTTVTGAPFGIPAFAILILVLGGATVAAIRWGGGARLRQQPPAQGAESSSRLKLAHVIAYGLLAIGLFIGVATWLRGLDGVPQLPPGGDATHHGFMVARIEHGHSVDVSRVVVFDSDGDHRSADYYPLAVHASAAIATGLVGADVGRVLVAFTVIFAAVVLPLGMFVLARFLVPSLPLIAGFTAFVTPSLMLFPYWAFSGGVVPAIVGLAMVPISVVLVTRAVLCRDSPLWPPSPPLVALVAAALALLAAISTHSSQLPLIVFLVLLLVLERSWRDRNAKVLLHALARAVVVGLLIVVMFAPTVGQFTGGASERSAITFAVLDADYKSLIKPIITLETGDRFATERQVLLGVLALAGAGIWLMRRRWAWVVGWISVMTLTFFAGTSDSSLVQQLTFPWYRIAGRIDWNQALFVPFFAAVALGLAVVGVARLLRARGAIVLTSSVAVIGFTVFAGAHAYKANQGYLHDSLTVNSTLSSQARVDRAAEAAFRWLHHHVHGDETVVNEASVDGSLWMYAQEGVKPLLGWAPTSLSSFREKYATSDWKNRVYLLANVERIGENPRIAELAHEYNARWIYFDDRNFPLTRHILRLDGLRQNAHISEVFHRNHVHVFRINQVDAELKKVGTQDAR